MYNVVLRDPSTTRDGVPIVVDTGGEYDDDREAAAESDARNLLQGEGRPRWAVEQSGVRVHDLECEPEDVVRALLALGASEEEAERLIG